MRAKEWNWGTKETASMTRRLVYRVARRVEKQKDADAEERKELPIKEIIAVGLGQYDLKRPKWYPSSAQIKSYKDDDWDDWTDPELQLILKRLANGARLKSVCDVFKIDEDFAQKISLRFYGRGLAPDDIPAKGAVDSRPQSEHGPKQIRAYVPENGSEPVESLESDEYDIGWFTPLDMVDTDDRRFANRRWSEYDKRLDLEKPANQTTVEMMVLLEVELKRVKREMNSATVEERKLALESIIKIRGEFSKAAADVAQLEKQQKTQPELEALDTIIERTHDIRKGWRNTTIENEMASRGLFDQVAEFHRIKLGDTDEPEDAQETQLVGSDIKIPRPTTKQEGASIPYRALREVEMSEGKDAGIVAESDG